MDEFLVDIHTEVYKRWILNQKFETWTIKLLHKNYDIIFIHTLYGEGKIVFYDFNIIELSVISNKDHQTKFYLHFQMNNMFHAIELFNEMIECLKSLNNHPKMRILLCCSGGLTTSYFAQKMKEANDLLSMDYEIQATGYNHLFEIGDEYDVIMLAPQISYMLSKAESIYTDKILFNIPAKIFAKYDVRGIFKLIEEMSNKQKSINKKTAISPLNQSFDEQLLCLSLFRNQTKVHIAYRLYDHSEIVINKEVIKNRIAIWDIYDVIDTILLNFPTIKIVVFSAPGIINEGKATSANVNGFEEMDYLGLFKKRYKQEFIIVNDVNTAAVGFHSIQNHSSIALMFQPMSTHAGIGIIINNQLVTGKMSVAGEVQYLPACKEYFHHENPNTPEKMLELVKRTSLSIISLLGIEVLAIYCTLIPHIEDLIIELEKEIPKIYIPEIVKVNDLQEYIFAGEVILAKQQLMKEKEK